MSAIGTIGVELNWLKPIADRLKEKYGARRVMLFGSVAWGEATEHSDIDLLIIAETKERFHQRIASALQTVRDVSRGMPLSPIVLTPKELQARLDRGDQFVQEILNAGIEL